MIAAPLFHSWGFANFAFGLALGSTYVLRRRFDPEATLAMVADNDADALAVVPVMLQRIMELDDEILERYDLPTLRVTAASGSALPGDLATRWMDAFGDNLYNFYGSTEVGWATIATPGGHARGARAPPAGRRAGTRIKILDEDGSARRRRARPGGSSSATRCRSRATPAAAARTSSTGCWPPATSATSTRTAACSSTAATTR